MTRVPDPHRGARPVPYLFSALPTCRGGKAPMGQVVSQAVLVATAVTEAGGHAIPA